MIQVHDSVIGICYNKCMIRKNNFNSFFFTDKLDFMAMEY